jgi:hypothetical protein
VLLRIQSRRSVGWIRTFFVQRTALFDPKIWFVLVKLTSQHATAPAAGGRRAPARREAEGDAVERQTITAYEPKMSLKLDAVLRVTRFTVNESNPTEVEVLM